MQYYIKFFNLKTGELVGYYKETGHNCVSSMMNGIKYFNDLDKAKLIADELDYGFLRDKDKHYYTAMTVVYGDSSRQCADIKKTDLQVKEELEDELEALIRKNSSKARRQTGN